MFGVTPEDRVLQFALTTFDISVWEFSVPLTMGASLIIARSDERNDNAKLAQLLVTQKVSPSVSPSSNPSDFLNRRSEIVT